MKIPFKEIIMFIVTIVILIVVYIATTRTMSFSALTTILSEQIKPDKSYTVDTAGLNMRVYEFTTQTEPKMKCVTTIVDNQAPSTQCIRVK